MEDLIEEIFTEEHERAKLYLENALKILGMAQIAAGTTDMFWTGLNVNIFNLGIIITGFIFFIGAEKLQSSFKKLIQKREREEEKYQYNDERVYDNDAIESLEKYHEKSKKRDLKKYGFANRK